VILIGERKKAKALNNVNTHKFSTASFSFFSPLPFMLQFSIKTLYCTQTDETFLSLLTPHAHNIFIFDSHSSGA
jgi:hypothetical protein